MICNVASTLHLLQLLLTCHFSLLTCFFHKVEAPWLCFFFLSKNIFHCSFSLFWKIFRGMSNVWLLSNSGNCKWASKKDVCCLGEERIDLVFRYLWHLNPEEQLSGYEWIQLVLGYSDTRSSHHHPTNFFNIFTIFSKQKKWLLVP